MTSELRCPPSFSAWRRRAGAGGRRHRARPCSPRAANNRPAPPRRAAPRRFPAPAGAPRRAPPRTGRRPAPASPAPRPTPRPPRGPHRYLPRPLSPAPAPGPHRPGARSCLFPPIPSVPAASPASTHPRAAPPPPGLGTCARTPPTPHRQVPLSPKHPARNLPRRLAFKQLGNLQSAGRSSSFRLLLFFSKSPPSLNPE